MKKNVRLGLVGYGTVGQGVMRILDDNRASIEKKIGATIEVAGIAELRPIDRKDLHVKDYRELLDRADIDIIVELIGGYEPAHSLIVNAVKSGKNVITANKAVLAKHWHEIFSIARTFNRLVYFEASVGGAIPVIQGLNEGLAANRVEKIMGILNGTTNYILSEMTSRNIDFRTALASAQKSGFAESDPSFDIEGIDTANKLAILSSLAWSSWIKVSDIKVTGIGQVSRDDVLFAKKFGYVIKLVGMARMSDRGLELSVEPTLIPLKHTFATVEKEYNAVLVNGDASGDIMFYGRGAGQLPAASAVVSDIISLSREVANGTAGKVPYISYEPQKKIRILSQAKIESNYYLRFSTQDQPGVLSKISGILGKCKVSIASVYQEEPLAGHRRGVPIIMLTHRTAGGDLDKALKIIDRLAIIKTRPVKLKII